MTDKLPARWRQWQRDREAAMIAGGVAPATAAEFSAIEARQRARAAEQVGFRAAAEAELHWVDLSDGTTRWFLSLNPSAVPPAQRETARRALGAMRLI